MINFSYDSITAIKKIKSGIVLVCNGGLFGAKYELFMSFIRNKDAAKMMALHSIVRLLPRDNLNERSTEYPAVMGQRLALYVGRSPFYESLGRRSDKVRDKNGANVKGEEKHITICQGTSAALRSYLHLYLDAAARLIKRLRRVKVGGVRLGRGVGI